LLTGLYALPFDLSTDLAPVILIDSEPLLIVGRKDLPATIRDVPIRRPRRSAGGRSSRR